MAFYEAHSWARGMLAGLPEPDAGVNLPGSPPAGFTPDAGEARRRSPGDHKRLFHVGSPQTPSRSYFPIEKKKTSLPMRKSRQTEHPHMNFRRLAASDAVTPAFLPGVSQIKRPCGEHAALCSDARHGPRPRGEPAPNGIPSDLLFIFNQCPVRERVVTVTAGPHRVEF